MCGRYSISIPELTLLSELFSLPMPLDHATRSAWRPNMNASPTQLLPVITRDGIQLLHWGWKPAWLKTSTGKPKLLINARSETVDEKNTFKKAFREARCLIPADAYYEWQVTTGGKIRQRIWPTHGYKGSSLFLMGGLLNSDGFVILTTSANEKLVEIHERMPVILSTENQQAIEEWLSVQTPADKIKSTFVPLAGSLVEFSSYRDDSERL